MVNITHKTSTLRKAIATAVVKTSSKETVDIVKNGKVPKGNVLDFARAAGLLAIKKTADVIPDCHPLPIEFAAITYELVDESIIISVEVSTIYKTGVEVEAMHGASITALVIYDMLKPIDKGVEIQQIRLKEKKGGKSDAAKLTKSIKTAVIVCSDSVAAGKEQDLSGKTIVSALEKHNIICDRLEVIPDDRQRIQQLAQQLSQEKFDLAVFTGGTGVSPRDVTPEALQPLLSKELPGVMEAARNYGQSRTPYAMLSRGVSGFINEMLVITMPGSRNGVEETMASIFPSILHVFDVRSGSRHSEL